MCRSGAKILEIDALMRMSPHDGSPIVMMAGTNDMLKVSNVFTILKVMNAF